MGKSAPQEVRSTSSEFDQSIHLLLLQHLEYGLVLVFYEYGEKEPTYLPRFEYFVHYPLSTSILPPASL